MIPVNIPYKNWILSVTSVASLRHDKHTHDKVFYMVGPLMKHIRICFIGVLTDTVKGKDVRPSSIEENAYKKTRIRCIFIEPKAKQECGYLPGF